MSQVAQLHAPVETVERRSDHSQVPGRRLAADVADLRRDGAEPRQSAIAAPGWSITTGAARSCRRITVQPVELDDALLEPQGGARFPARRPIVGFYCTTCRHEWSPRATALVTADER